MILSSRQDRQKRRIELVETRHWEVGDSSGECRSGGEINKVPSPRPKEPSSRLIPQLVNLSSSNNNRSRRANHTTPQIESRRLKEWQRHVVGGRADDNRPGSCAAFMQQHQIGQRILFRASHRLQSTASSGVQDNGSAEHSPYCSRFTSPQEPARQYALADRSAKKTGPETQQQARKQAVQQLRRSPMQTAAGSSASCASRDSLASTRSGRGRRQPHGLDGNPESIAGLLCFVLRSRLEQAMPEPKPGCRSTALLRASPPGGKHSRCKTSKGPSHSIV